MVELLEMIVDEMVPAWRVPYVNEFGTSVLDKEPILREDKVESPAVKVCKGSMEVLPLTVSDERVEIPAVRLPGVRVLFCVVPISREDKVELPAVRLPGLNGVPEPILSVGPVSEPENTGSVELSLSCRV